jgi:ABC-type microcin C transport system permease subunit YejB
MCFSCLSSLGNIYVQFLSKKLVMNLILTFSSSCLYNLFQVLYLVASNEMAEEVSQKLGDGLKSLGTVVSCFTTATHFSKDSFESTEVLVTTVNMWRDVVCTLGKRCKIFFKHIFCSNKGHSHYLHIHKMRSVSQFIV